MEKAKTTPLGTEFVQPSVSYLETLENEQAVKVLRSLGEGAVVKTAFEALAATEAAQLDAETAQRVMSASTKYTMPEGDPPSFDI